MNLVCKITFALIFLLLGVAFKEHRGFAQSVLAADAVNQVGSGQCAQADTLATCAANREIKFGTYFVVPAPDAGFKAAVHEFNLYTLPVLFNLIWPNESGNFNFDLPDKVAESAPEGVVFQIFSPIWCEQLPQWLKNGKHTADQLRAILNLYLSTVINHFQTKFPGRIFAWEVVNEPLSYLRTDPACIWHKIGLDSQTQSDLAGYEYIRQAFQQARALAPTTKLYINNFGAEDMGPRSQSMFDLVSYLIDRQVPIDGIGLESHFMLEAGGPFPQVPPADQIVQNLNRLGSLGLDTMITEADVSIKDSELIANPDSVLQQQAETFRILLHACISANSCKAFTAFGVGDIDSWIPKDFPDAIGWGHPLLFDSNYKAKPAYDACKAELSNGS